MVCIITFSDRESPTLCEHNYLSSHIVLGCVETFPNGGTLPDCAGTWCLISSTFRQVIVLVSGVWISSTFRRVETPPLNGSLVGARLREQCMNHPLNNSTHCKNNNAFSYLVVNAKPCKPELIPCATASSPQKRKKVSVHAHIFDLIS